MSAAATVIGGPLLSLLLGWSLLWIARGVRPMPPSRHRGYGASSGGGRHDNASWSSPIKRRFGLGPASRSQRDLTSTPQRPLRANSGRSPGNMRISPSRASGSADIRGDRSCNFASVPDRPDERTQNTSTEGRRSISCVQAEGCWRWICQ